MSAHDKLEHQLLDSISARRQPKRSLRAVSWVGVAVACAVAVAVAVIAITSLHPRHTTPPPTSGGVQLANLKCSTAVAPALELSTPVRFVHVGGTLVGVSVTADGRWAFVDESPTPPGEGRVIVMSVGADGVPHQVRAILVPGSLEGSALIDDGRYLLVADDAGVSVLSVARAEQGSSGAVLGTLSEGGTLSRTGTSTLGEPHEVIASPDGRYVFVSALMGQGAVFDLQRAISEHFDHSALVGVVPAFGGGIALSPDGRWLYTTWAGQLAPPRPGQGRLAVIYPAAAEHGKFDVTGLTAAELSRLKAIAATVPGLCGPADVAVSPDGSTVWVTARGSDQLLAFSASKLIRDPAHALIAAVRVGEAPSGLTLIDNGRLTIVADTNNLDARGEHSALTVLSTVAVLAHRPAILGTVRAGPFPQQMALEPNGQTLLVTDFDSGNIEVVPVNKLPK